MPGFAPSEERVRFADRSGRLLLYFDMMQPDLPPMTNGVQVEGPTGAEPLIAHPGQVTVVTSWASWCGVCKAEMPALRTLRADLGVEIRAVSVEPRDDFRKVQAFLRRNGVATFAPLRDPAGVLGPMLGTRAVPASLIVDKYGQVVGLFRGGAPWHSQSLRGWLRALQQAQSPEESRVAHSSFVK
ncbi:MAG: TlpA disulfide reductase family protein [Pseudomonadota bacterium]